MFNSEDHTILESLNLDFFENASDENLLKEILNAFNGEDLTISESPNRGSLEQLSKESLLSRKEKNSLIDKGLRALDNFYSKQKRGIPPKVKASNNCILKDIDLNVPLEFVLSLDEGVVINDSQGNVIAYNEQVKRLLSCPHPEQCSSKMQCINNVKDFYEDKDECKKIAEELKEQELIQDISLRIKDCQGRPIFFKVSMSNFYDEEGNRQGCINLFLRDRRTENRNLKLIMDFGCELLKVDDAILWLVDDFEKSLDECEAHIEISKGKIDPDYCNEELTLDKRTVNKFINSELPLTVHDMTEKNWHDKFQSHDWAMKHGWKSLLSVPILLDDKLIGVWNLYCRNLRYFDKIEIKFADMLGKNMSHVLSKSNCLDTLLFYQFVSLYEKIRESREDYGQILINALDQREKDERYESQKSKYFHSYYGWMKDTVFEYRNNDYSEAKKIEESIKKAIKDIISHLKCESLLFFLRSTRHSFQLKRIVEIHKPLYQSKFQNEGARDYLDGVSSIFDFTDSENKILNSAKTKIENISLNKALRLLLEKEKVIYLGDLALMTENGLYDRFDILPNSSKFSESLLIDIKALLKEYGLHLGMEFPDKGFTYLLLNEDVSDSELVHHPWFERVSENILSSQILHLLAVPIKLRLSKNSYKRFAGYIVALNKAREDKVPSAFNDKTKNGFTVDDVLFLQQKIRTIGEFISSYCRELRYEIILSNKKANLM